jgi:hypothetical protein
MYDLIFCIGFTVQDSYRINSYRICLYQLNNKCMKIFYESKSYTILCKSYESKGAPNMSISVRMGKTWLDAK